MLEDIALNQKAVADIVEDLARAGFIEKSFIKEGRGKFIENITFTKAGCDFIAAYAKAFGSIRNKDERHIKVFDIWLKAKSRAWAEQHGLIAGEDGVGDDD